MTTETLAYDTHGAARVLGLSERTIRNMISRGEIPYSRIGKRVLITRATLESLLLERQQRRGVTEVG